MLRRHCFLRWGSVVLALIGMWVGMWLMSGPPRLAYGQVAATRTPKVCHFCESEPSVTPLSSTSTPSAGHTMRVRLVMFWMNGCPHCHEVLEHVFPPLQRQYGEALEIRLIEIATAEDVDYFYQVIEFYGIPREQAGVPFLILGDHVLKGSTLIASNLPALIEQTLAQGGCDWPALPGPLPQQITTESTPITVPLHNGESPLIYSDSGFNLLYAVMGLNAASILYALVSVIQARISRMQVSSSSRSNKGRMQAILVLALIGLGIALYLSVIEISGREAWCGPVGNCNAVQTSAYARLWGVLPVALLGVMGYTTLIGLWVWAHYEQGRWGRMVPVGIWGVALFGASFSLYLSFLEAVVIRAVCGWCMASAVIMSLILLLSVQGARQALRLGAGLNLS